MKKKLLVWTLLLLLPVLAACNAAESAVATPAPAEITEAPAAETEPPAPATPEPVSPIHETDAEGLIKATGIALTPPEGAENAVYSYLQNGQERPTARLKFTLDGVNGWIYAKPYAGFAPPDTSALYQKSAETMVGESRGIVYTRDDAGYIAWVDADSGVLYELGLSAGADAGKLTALADAVYAELGKSGYDAYTVTVSADGKEIARLSDVVFGELWLSFGQSNMEYPLRVTPEGKEMIASELFSGSLPVRA